MNSFRIGGAQSITHLSVLGGLFVLVFGFFTYVLYSNALLHHQVPIAQAGSSTDPVLYYSDVTAVPQGGWICVYGRNIAGGTLYIRPISGSPAPLTTSAISNIHGTAVEGLCGIVSGAVPAGSDAKIYVAFPGPIYSNELDFRKTTGKIIHKAPVPRGNDANVASGCTELYPCLWPGVASILAPGDQVILIDNGAGDGTHSEVYGGDTNTQWYFTNANGLPSGTAANPITVRGKPGTWIELPSFDPDSNPVTSGMRALRVAGLDYWQFTGIAAYAAAGVFSTAANTRIANMYFSDNNYNAAPAFYRGAMMNGMGASIIGNRFAGHQQGGIHVQEDNSVVAHNMIIDGGAASASSGGVMVTDDNGTPSNIDVHSNYISQNALGYGSGVFIEGSLSTVTNVRVHNNIIPRMSHGVHLASGSDIYIYNNTLNGIHGVYMTNNGSCATVQTGNVVIKNNIFTNANQYIENVGSCNGITLTSDYNIFQTNLATSFQWLAAPGNFASWQTSTGGDANACGAGACDVNSIFGSPQYVNEAAFDFHLQPTSPARNRIVSNIIAPGVTISTRDYEWNTRPQQTNYDVGAYEDVYIDTVPPTIDSVSSNIANGSYRVGQVIDIDVTFSEPVTSTGVVTVTLDTGRSCTFTVTNAATGTCNYTVQAGDTSADLDTVSIAGTIRDLANNAMTDFNPTTRLSTNKDIVIDTTAPTVTINQKTTAPAQADPTGTPPINFTAVFSENVTGFTNTDVIITGTAGGTKTVTVTPSTPPAAMTYNIAVTGMTGGTVIANIPQNAAQDLAGNSNALAATFTDNVVTFASVCGNTITEPGEMCDDGNTNAGDGCSPTCQTEVCGNGIVEPGEMCDDGDGINDNGCSNACVRTRCGDGTINNPNYAGTIEQCDDGNLLNTDQCNSSCQPTTCGDGTRQSPNGAGVNEACDQADLAGQQCADLGFAGGGTLACTAACAYDTSACITQVCGNNAIEGTEVCDGTDLAGNTCTSVPGGYIGGTLACNATCNGWDTSACTSPPVTVVPNQPWSAASDLRPLDAAGNAAASSWEVAGKNVLAIKVWVNQLSDARGFQAVYVSPTVNTIFFTRNNSSDWSCSYTYTPGWEQIDCPDSAADTDTISECSVTDQATTWSRPFTYTGSVVSGQDRCAAPYTNQVGGNATWVWSGPDGAGQCNPLQVAYCRLEFGIELGPGEEPYDPGTGAYCGDGIVQGPTGTTPGPEECDNGTNNGACPRSCSTQCLRNDCSGGGGGVGGCFAPGTKVLTPEGPKSIDTLHEGDTVVAYDEASGAQTTATVAHRRVYARDHIYVLNDSLRVTQEHRFAVTRPDGTIEWTEVYRLRIGDVLIDAHGQAMPVTSIERYQPQQSIEVYNPELTYPNTYYVLVPGRGYVLVHNAKVQNPEAY